MPKTIAIIQARMSSTRLPGKVLLEIAGRPMIWHVLMRTKRAASLDGVVLATTTEASDDPLAAFCACEGIPCYRGSLDDVLDRYYQAAKWADAAVVVRITGDCPLIDPEVIDKVVGCFSSGNFDYGSNTHPPTFPDGLDTEVFTFGALEKAWRGASLKSEREHVTPYLYKYEGLFKVLNVRNERDWSSMRWTVDEPEDLELVRAIVGRLGVEKSRMDDVVALLEVCPDMSAINAAFERNEGYQKSLRNDEVAKNAKGKE